MATKKSSHESGGFRHFIGAKEGPGVYGWQKELLMGTEVTSDSLLVNISKKLLELLKKKPIPSILEELTRVFATEEQCGRPIPNPDHIDIIYGEVDWKPNFKETKPQCKIITIKKFCGN